MQPAMAGTRAPAGKWVVAGTVVLGSFVSVMDISIVNVAMPQMLSTFGVSLDAITWVAVSYSITEIILVTMAAWFSSLLGRKRFFIISFVLFTAALQERVATFTINVAKNVSMHEGEEHGYTRRSGEAYASGV